MTGVFNTKYNSHKFLDRIQFPASVNCNITIYHTLSRYLTSIFLHNSTLPAATKSIKLGANLSFLWYAALTEIFKGRLGTIPCYK